MKGNPFKKFFDIHVRGKKNINPIKNYQNRNLGK
jgi:hypothetical protein